MPPEARRRSSVAGGAWGWRDPTDAEFRAFVALVHDVSGIALNDSKRALVARRLNARLRMLGVERLGDYVKLVRADESGAECVTLLDLIATNETHFFRERAHFDFLESTVFPRWIAEASAGARPRVIRAWSAACSTGQEPFSLAMQMLETLPPEHGWRIEIEATDIDTQALELAERAEWPVEKAKEIPQRYLQRFMLRGTGPQDGWMRAMRELRQVVRFSRLNLNEKYYAVPGKFDLIFCRNVLIYFSPESRAAVIERLADRLVPGGLLFVGHAESLHGHRARLRAILPTVYSRAA
ncbi:MAG TPA: protein-glutamate O-methyltransferase CheR [Gemmatimonadaceae bacterium]|nr:protein-glutamate O-methyltransferase CheR [Gemmatimonadaceae bacterium]